MGSKTQPPETQTNIDTESPAASPRIPPCHQRQAGWVPCQGLPRGRLAGSKKSLPGGCRPVCQHPRSPKTTPGQGSSAELATGTPVLASGSVSVGSEDELRPAVLQLTMGFSVRRGSPRVWPPSPPTEPLVNSARIKAMSPRALHGKRWTIVRAQKSPGKTIKAAGPALRALLSIFICLCWNYIATFPFSCPLPTKRRGYLLRQLLQAPIYIVIIFRGLLRREGPGEGEE